MLAYSTDPVFPCNQKRIWRIP